MILTMTLLMSAILQVMMILTHTEEVWFMGQDIDTVTGTGATTGLVAIHMDAVTVIITTTEDGIVMTGIAITMANMFRGIIVTIPKHVLSRRIEDMVLPTISNL